MPLGAHVRVFALDTESGDAASLEFEHDGSPRTLVLTGGRRITGRLAPPPGQAMPPRVDVSWYLRGRALTNRWVHVDPELPEAEPRRGSAEGLAVRADGRFTFVTPVAPFAEGERPEDESIAVELQVSGFERASVEVPTGGAKEIDLGTIPLAPRAPDFLIAPPLPAALDSLAPGALVRCLPDRPALAHVVDDVARAPDGTLEVRTRRRPQGARRLWYVYDVRQHAYTWLPAEPRPSAGIVLSTDRGGVALQRGRDRRYRAVPTRPCAFVLELGEPPPGAAALELAWTWRGVESPCARIERGQREIEVRVDVPREGAGLRWRAVRPPSGGAMRPAGGELELPCGGRLRLP